MKTIRKKIGDLTPAPYNPRVDLAPGDPEYDALVRSITELGYALPLVWNRRSGYVVGGHQRLKVLTDLGYTSLPVVPVDLDDTDERRLNLALNKIEGRWNDDRLATLLEGLEDTGQDITITGFTDQQFDDLLRRVDQAQATTFLDGLDSDDVKRTYEDPAVGDHPEWGIVSYPVRADQRTEARTILDDVRKHLDVDTSGAALIAIADRYLAAHPDADPDKDA